MRPLFRFSLIAAVAVAVSLAAAGGEQRGAPVELGRQFKAMPWLGEYGDDVPFEIVKFETLPVMRGIPQKTAYYEIDSDVVAQGYAYFYYVKGIDRDFVIGSTFKLAKLCRELAVIEEMKKIHKGKEFASGVGDAFVGIGKGLGNLIMHPGSSMKSMGSSFRSAGRSIERAVGAEDKLGVDESGVNRSLLGEGPYGDVRRALAYELGIDVYTDNPVLKDILTELSQAKGLGSVASWVVPYGLSMADRFNPLAGDEEVEAFIRDNNPYDLRRTAGTRLGDFYGMDRHSAANPLGRLLANPNYTPRGIAYIEKDLLLMRNVAGHETVLTILASAETPEEADLLSVELRLYSFYHGRIAPLHSFHRLRNFFAAFTADGVYRLLFAADTIRPWSHSKEALDATIREAVSLGAKGLEIWTTADVDPAVVEQARRQGVRLVPNIMRNKQFFPAPEQEQFQVERGERR